MRVTTKMLAENILFNLQQNIRQTGKLYQEISSGRKISGISQNLPVLNQVMTLKEELSRQEQLNRNIDSGLLWLNETDRALDQATEILEKAETIALAGANNAAGTVDLKALAAEVDALINEMVDVANTSLNDRYLFVPFHRGVKPFVRQGDGVILEPSLEQVAKGDSAREILPGTAVVVNVNGKEIFIDRGVFASLFNLKQALAAKDIETVRTMISDLARSREHILDARASSGAKAGWLEFTKEQLAARELNLSEYLSSLESADIAESATRLAEHLLAYQAAIAAGTKILSTSLVNFLS